MVPKPDINFNRLLEKMLSGEMKDAEKHQLETYISSTYKDKELDEFMSQHWKKLQNSNVDGTDLYFHQLKTRIWSKISSDQQQRKITGKQVTPWKSYLARIAAMLFIPLLISSVYMFYRLHEHPTIESQTAMQQVFASPGSRVQFTLPDQSRVWLNSGSSLEYPINLNIRRERKVKLSGQGYFEVNHDEKHPFIVETGELNIKVLGTSFDVSNYSNDQQISSTLEQGSIALLNSIGEEVARLGPGQKAMLDKGSRKLLIKEVDTRLTTSWKDGRLVFKNTPLREVTKQLERWFNCSIVVAPALLGSDILYTATIQDETLVEVLSMIEISTKVKTKIENREVKIME